MEIICYVAECLCGIAILFGSAYKWLINTDSTNRVRFIWIEYAFFGSSWALAIVMLIFLFVYFFDLFKK